jgi:excinuclease UvrABC nuclease subunit
MLTGRQIIKEFKKSVINKDQTYREYLDAAIDKALEEENYEFAIRLTKKLEKLNNLKD